MSQSTLDDNDNNNKLSKQSVFLVYKAIKLSVMKWEPYATDLILPAAVRGSKALKSLHESRGHRFVNNRAAMPLAVLHRIKRGTTTVDIFSEKTTVLISLLGLASSPSFRHYRRICNILRRVNDGMVGMDFFDVFYVECCTSIKISESLCEEIPSLRPS